MGLYPPTNAVHAQMDVDITWLLSRELENLRTRAASNTGARVAGIQTLQLITYLTGYDHRRRLTAYKRCC
jgi:hypothetical protein